MQFHFFSTLNHQTRLLLDHWLHIWSKCILAITNILVVIQYFHRTQVNLGSDLWVRMTESATFVRLNWWGNLLRSVPFLMAGHLNINIFQTLGTPFFNTNPKNGCPKIICQYSGQAPRHFTCRFHYMSCSTDVRPWDSKRKFLFLLQIVPITKTLVPNALK